MKTFEVFYEDGNRRLFDSPSFEALCNHLMRENEIQGVFKISERVDGKTL